jgi:hypothetical protein
LAGICRTGVVIAALTLATAGSAAAHGQPAAAPAGPPAGAPVARSDVQLRRCWMTVAFVPRPAAALARGLVRPLDLSQTFYGSDPLLGIWALRCDRARVGRARIRGAVVSLVGVPLALSDAHAPPLANFFAHALLRVDTSSRVLAAALRRAGLPARAARAARYRHSQPGVLPATGTLAVPGQYRLGVSATQLDPTNPHDHVNRFEHRGRGGRSATVDLRVDDAFDRFCFPVSGGCSATVRARPGSMVGGLLGAAPAPVRVGFDHARLARVELSVSRRVRLRAPRP